MGYIAGFLIIELLVAVVASFTLSKRVCLVISGISLFLGIVTPLVVWGYAGMFVAGHESYHGMLGTGLMVLFAPGGIVLALLSMSKRG